MLKRRSAPAILLVLCLSAVGCSFINGPVKEAEALVTAKDAFTSKWQEIAEKNQTQAGIDEVKKLWNDKKADLIAKRDALKNANQGVNKDWQAIVFRSESRDTSVLNAIEFKFGGMNLEDSSVDSKSLQQQFQTIRKEYETAIKR